jgi:hypothetical protein
MGFLNNRQNQKFSIAIAVVMESKPDTIATAIAKSIFRTSSLP